MKKNLLIKTFSGIAALSSFASIASLSTLTSCTNKPQIIINNKISDLDWMDRPYQLDVTFKNQKDADVLFTSSNPQVASIDQQGRIRGISNGTTTIKAYSSKDTMVCDQFDLSVNELWIGGKITDLYGTALSNVHISYDGQTTTSENDGTYKLKLAKPGAVLYFEKIGYLGEVYESSYALASVNHVLNVKLVPFGLGKTVHVEGTVKDVSGNLVRNCSVTFNSENMIKQFHTITDNNGHYSIDVENVDPENPQVTFITHKAEYDTLEQVIDVSDSTVTHNITLYPFQYDVKAYVGNTRNNEKIIMHAYYTQDAGMEIKLESNFLSAFDASNKFKLTFTNNRYISQPNKTQHRDWEYDITFDSAGNVEITGWDGPRPYEVEVQYNPDNKFNLSVFIYEGLGFTFEGTVGINFNSFGRGTFTPYEHAKYGTEPSNELSYVRLDCDTNALYPSSDNLNIFGLNWDTPSGDGWHVSDVLGYVASKYNFGYQIKVAKYYDPLDSDAMNGIYIMTKYSQDQMAHYLPDGYQPHFFFYTNQLEEDEQGKYIYPTDSIDDPTVASTIKHIAPISGYWMQTFDIKDSHSPFENKKEYDQFFDATSIESSPKLYCKEDLMITYIPFSFLNNEGQPFTSDMTFGLACNLQYEYTGGTWHAWQGANPTGYVNVPHFEETTSYIQFDPELNIIPYRK